MVKKIKVHKIEKIVPPIRWDKNTVADLKKGINNYNAKIKRLKAKNYDSEMIPKKLSFKEMKDTVKTRADYHEQMELISALTTRGSERKLSSTRGLKLPRFAKVQTEIKVKAINKERAKHKKDLMKLPVTDRNKRMGKGNEDRSDLVVNKIKPKSFNWENMSKKDFQMFNRTMYEYGETDLQKSIKDERYRDNYYKAMEATLSDEQFEEMKLVMDKVPTKKLIEQYYTDINMGIESHYEATEQQIRYEESLKAWSSVVEQGGY